MIEIIDLLMGLSQEVRDLRTRIELLNATKVEYLKNAWVDNQDVMQMLHISPRTLQSFRTNIVRANCKISGKIYYKVADIEELLQANYYNPNFKCDGRK